MKKFILIIEDEKEISLSIAQYLNNLNYECIVATNIKEAYEKIKLYPFECILIDIGLPDGYGIDLINYIKSKKIDSGILIISAKESVDVRIEALEKGADDYLVKPFQLAELAARIHAIIRRKKFNGNSSIVFNEIRISPFEQKVLINNIELRLTKKEFELLLFFMSNENKMLTKETIAFNIWKNNADIDVSNDIIYAHIKNLRKKLHDAGCGEYLKAVYGVGYKFSKQ